MEDLGREVFGVGSVADLAVHDAVEALDVVEVDRFPAGVAVRFDAAEAWRPRLAALGLAGGGRSLAAPGVGRHRSAGSVMPMGRARGYTHLGKAGFVVVDEQRNDRQDEGG